jgi:hypothetical protein
MRTRARDNNVKISANRKEAKDKKGCLTQAAGWAKPANLFFDEDA